MKFRLPLIFALSAAALIGCSDSSDTVTGNSGSLTLDIVADGTILDPVSGLPVETTAPVPELSAITVTMTMEGSSVYSHTWTSAAEIDQALQLRTGNYRIFAESGTGPREFRNPTFRGDATATVRTNSTTDVNLQMTLADQAVRVNFDRSVTDYFTSVSAIIHPEGGGFATIQPDDNGFFYLPAARTGVYVNATLPDGRETGFRAMTLENVREGYGYDYNISMIRNSDGTPCVMTNVAGTESSVLLTESFLAAEPPTVSCAGWDPQSTLALPEGDLPAAPVRFIVRSAAPLAHLYLSVGSYALADAGLPSGQIDLLNLTAEIASQMRALGLSWRTDALAAEADFTELLGNLVYLTADTSLSTFGLLAEDEAGRVSEPVTLRVETLPVGLEIVSVGYSPVGSEHGTVTVRAAASDFDSRVAVELFNGRQWEQTRITDIEPGADGIRHLTFTIPAGSDDVRCRVVYCGEVRGEFTIVRTLPPFSLDVDPFATYALIRVSAADPSAIATVTSDLILYIDGERANILSRNAEKGLIAVTGLRPDRTYTLTATLMPHPDSEGDYTPEQRFTTEGAPALPNGDFENRSTGVNYAELPSGGRYSQTVVPIFNWQNSRSFSEQVPSGWANTNTKTFCRSAVNHNTWYMQPSVTTVKTPAVASGEFAVCLRSVAFDLDGRPIPNYTQTGRPYLDYSPVVPEIAHRAAGKIFLGDYEFNPLTLEERYADEVSWDARPLTLNGFYMYTPCADDPRDTGTALIEVYGTVDGRREVIASGTARLGSANTYTAFTVRLDYERFGVKATAIKVMFASSRSIGTLAEESRSIVTAPDPKEGASVGSVLWLDNLSLGY